MQSPMHDFFLPTHEVNLGVQKDRLQTSLRLGYSTVVTVCRAGERTKPDDRVDPILEGGEAYAPTFCQLNRVHIVAEEPSQAQALVNAELTKRCWDIISIQPQSERVLQQACSSLSVDLITLDLATRLPFKLRPAVLKPAVERGIHFEILYAPALREPSGRRNVFSNAQALCRVLNGKHIIVSSGARSGMELRGPQDVINMATFFGLDQAGAKASITSRCEAVLAKAAMRKLHKASLRLNMKASFLAQAPIYLAQDASEGVPPDSEAMQE